MDKEEPRFNYYDIPQEEEVAPEAVAEESEETAISSNRFEKIAEAAVLGAKSAEPQRQQMNKDFRATNNVDRAGQESADQMKKLFTQYDKKSENPNNPISNMEKNDEYKSTLQIEQNSDELEDKTEGTREKLSSSEEGTREKMDLPTPDDPKHSTLSEAPMQIGQVLIERGYSNNRSEEDDYNAPAPHQANQPAISLSMPVMAGMLLGIITAFIVILAIIL